MWRLIKIEDTANWILATASTTGVVGWLLGRRRSNAETKGVEIENGEKVVIADMNNIERLTRRLNELIVTLDQQMAENIKLKYELHAIRIALENERISHQELMRKYEKQGFSK
jgi:hypothetical protein